MLKTEILVLAMVQLVHTLPTRYFDSRPIVLTAPMSQIQWRVRGNWVDGFFTDNAPRSYHIQYSKRKNYNYGDRVDPGVKLIDKRSEDLDTSAERVEYSIEHPRMTKYLQISVEPSKNDDTPKLSLKDSLLGDVNFATTPQPKRATTARRTRKPSPTTRRPKPQIKPKPKPMDHRFKNTDTIDEEETSTDTTGSTTLSTTSTTRLQHNLLGGSSQVGNRESQMVIKPTVIVNFRGTVTNTDRDITLESRTSEQEGAIPTSVFNINQEVNVDRTFSSPDQDASYSNRSAQPGDKKTRLDINIRRQLPNKKTGEPGEVKIQASIKPNDVQPRNVDTDSTTEDDKTIQIKLLKETKNQ